MDAPMIGNLIVQDVAMFHIALVNVSARTGENVIVIIVSHCRRDHRRNKTELSAHVRHQMSCILSKKTDLRTYTICLVYVT